MAESLSGRVKWSFVIQEALLLLVLPYFLILTGITPLLVNFDVIRGAAILLTLMAGAWLIFGQSAPIPLGKPLLLFMAAFAVCTAFSMDWSRSLEQMALTLVGIFIFALAADLTARGWPSEMFARAFLIVGLLIPILIWADVFGWYRQWLAVHPGEWLPSLIYRPNYANNVVVPCYLMLLLIAAYWFSTKGKLLRGLLIVYALGLLATIFITSSRGGWLATAAGLGVLAVLLYWKRKQELKGWWDKVKAQKWLLRVGVALALVGLAGVGWVGLKLVSHPSHGALLSSRSEFWPAAIATFLKHPLTGQGPYTFTNAYLAYNSVPPKGIFYHAHDALLNLLAEMGLVGALTFGVVLFFLVRLLKRRLDRAAGMDLPLVMAAAAGVAALAVNSISECFHMEPVITVGLFLILGAALAEPGGEHTNRKRRPYWALLPVALVWAEVWMMAPLFPGVAAANANQLPTAQAAFQEAVRREPWSVIAHQQLGQVYAMEADQGSTDALPKAIAELEQVVARDPSWSANWLNLGALYRQQGDLVKARGALDAALKAAPGWSLAYLNLGVVAEQQGDRAAALAAYGQALAKGEMLEVSFWEASPVRMEAAAAWKAAQPVAPQPSLDELRAAVAQNPERAYLYLDLAKAELKAGNLDAAERVLRQVSLAYTSPPDLVERDWLLAEMYAAQGEMDKAAELGQKALEGYERVGLNGPGSMGVLYYAPVMYRRPGMERELVGGVVGVLSDILKNRDVQFLGWQE